MARPDYRKFVADQVRDLRCKRVAEIGVWRGALSRLLWRLPLEQLILVDPWSAAAINCEREGVWRIGTMGERSPEDPFTQRDMDAVYREVKRAAPKFVRFLRVESVEAAKKIPNASLDYVYIDSMHYYDDLKADITAWLPKVRPGGRIAGHDMYERFPGVERAVTELLPGFEKWGVVWWKDLC